jgi:hypothetical protein
MSGGLQIALLWMLILAAKVKTVKMDTAFEVADLVPTLNVKARGYVCAKCCPSNTSEASDTSLLLLPLPVPLVCCCFCLFVQ